MHLSGEKVEIQPRFVSITHSVFLCIVILTTTGCTLGMQAPRQDFRHSCEWHFLWFCIKVLERSRNVSILILTQYSDDLL